jgi:hypothetical protein
VKGTTTDGEAIVLTNNEVKHACETNNTCALFVLHSIRLEKKVASGGQHYIIDPWELQNEYLTPVSYTYRIRGKPLREIHPKKGEGVTQARRFSGQFRDWKLTLRLLSSKHRAKASAKPIPPATLQKF